MCRIYPFAPGHGSSKWHAACGRAETSPAGGGPWRPWRRGAEGGDAGKSLFLKMGRSRERYGKIEKHMGNSLYKLDVFLGFGESSVNGRVFHCRVWLQGIPSSNLEDHHSDFPRTPWASLLGSSNSRFDIPAICTRGQPWWPKVHMLGHTLW